MKDDLPKFEDFLEEKMRAEGGLAKLSGQKPETSSNSRKGPTVRVAQKDGEKPFGDHATPSLKNPKHNLPHGEKAGLEGLTTEGFVERTNKMSDAEYVAFVVNEAKKDKGPTEIPPIYCQYSGKPVMPSAIEVARFMAHVIPNNEMAVRTFIDELKSVPDGLSTLLREMSGYREMYSEVVNQMGDPETKVARRLAEAMHDNHLAFMDELGLLQSEAVSLPMDDRLPQSGVPQSAMQQTTMPYGPPAPQIPQPQQGAPLPPGMPGVPDDANLLSDAPGPDDSIDLTGQEEQTPEWKLNKEFAYHHMIREMSKYQPMMNVMREMMGGM